jgi:hypothetical protein
LIDIHTIDEHLTLDTRDKRRASEHGGEKAHKRRDQETNQDFQVQVLRPPAGPSGPGGRRQSRESQRKPKRPKRKLKRNN